MNNIISFPKTKNSKIQEAIDDFGFDHADRALDKFNKLIDEGCDEAFAFVGAIYEYGAKNVEKNYENALFYYTKSVERFGAVEAYLGLIRIYFYGLGVERDCCKAIEYCNTMIEDKNDKYAHFFMGKMYLEGCCLDIDIDKARDHFKAAWKEGYIFGLTYLGLLEQTIGNKLKGWVLRIKAGLLAFLIARKNINDPRIREI